MNRLLLIGLLIINCLVSSGQDNYPTPTQMEGVLFYIQHNRGKNTFIYRLNYQSDKTLNMDEPIQVYRQLFDNGGVIRPLTIIQKNFAYGIDAKLLKNNRYEASIVSLPEQKLFLHFPSKGDPYVSTTVAGTSFILKRIFIRQKDGTSGLSTKVDYILFYGVKDGKNVMKKLVP